MKMTDFEKAILMNLLDPIIDKDQHDIGGGLIGQILLCLGTETQKGK